MARLSFEEGLILKSLFSISFVSSVSCSRTLITENWAVGVCVAVWKISGATLSSLSGEGEEIFLRFLGLEERLLAGG